MCPLVRKGGKPLKPIYEDTRDWHHFMGAGQGLKMDQAKRLKALEKENGRLKKLVADLSLDNQILKEVSSGNF